VSNRSKAALYSITSSARASSVGGTSRPSACAVFKLITTSYLVGACTGRSARHLLTAIGLDEVAVGEQLLELHAHNSGKPELRCNPSIVVKTFCKRDGCAGKSAFTRVHSPSEDGRERP
jgi:hypothetical protein